MKLQRRRGVTGHFGPQAAPVLGLRVVESAYNPHTSNQHRWGMNSPPVLASAAPRLSSVDRNNNQQAVQGDNVYWPKFRAPIGAVALILSCARYLKAGLDSLSAILIDLSRPCQAKTTRPGPRWLAILFLLTQTMLANPSQAADWAKSFSAPLPTGELFATATAVDAAGNTFIAGQMKPGTATFGAMTLTGIGDYDAFVAKLDSTGTVLWARVFGGPGATTLVGQSLAVDGNGSVYLGGEFVGASLTTPALTKIGINDAFAFKLDAGGNIVWAKNFGGAGAIASATSLAVDGGGNVYLGGSYSNNLTTPALAMIGGYDAFAFKLDAGGSVTWAKNFGGAGAIVYGQSIAVDGSGNVYLGGNFTGSNLTTPALTRIGDYDAFAFKLDSSGDVTWAKNFGDAGASVYGQSLAVDDSGNVYLGGYFTGANLATPALTMIGNYDAFAFKLDAGGSITWATNFGGAGASAFSKSLAVDSGGNVYLGGHFHSANLTAPTLIRIGDIDAFAFKLDSTGGVTWAKNFGGTGAGTIGRSLAVDANSNVYLGGNSIGANLTTPALTKIGNIDAFAFKLDSAGNIAWAKNFGVKAPAAMVVLATTVDIDGNSYIAGQMDQGTAKLDGITLTSIGFKDTFVAKLDSSGTVLWARNFGGAGAETRAGHLAVDASGNIYLGGSFYNGNLTTPTLTMIGSYDAFAVKLNASGSVMWAKNFGGVGANAYGQALAVDSDGNVYLGGSFSNGNLTDPSLTRIGNYDAFAFKLDSIGSVIWARNFGGASTGTYGQSMATDNSGNVYLGGYFYGVLSTPALTSIGAYDTFAFKLDSTGGITWAKNFGGAGAVAFGQSLVVDDNRNVYLGGHFTDANLTTPALTRIGVWDTFAFRLDASGGVIWAKNFGGAGAQTAGFSLAVDGSGNLYVAGDFYNASLATPVLTKIGDRDAFAFKLDSTGGLTWAKNFGGAGAMAGASSVAVDGSGNIYLGGYFFGANLTTPALSGTGVRDAFVLRESTIGPLLQSVVSKKFHGAQGQQDLPLTLGVVIGGAVSVEPRSIGAGHRIAFLFDQPMTSVGSATAVDAANVSIGIANTMPSGNSVIVTLTDVPDNRRAMITLGGLNGTGAVAAVTMGFLVGDVSGNGSVKASDISAVKARVGKPIAGNAAFDLDLSGVIDNNDVLAAKARAGMALP